ncbi:hypothetical protein SLEP1_g17189 [Rubroshorea leprosula]|uniref:Uncharacterized protein n=1 Tax=Rubroshorea leprosula TaxID=152421 RepID=A0AAV5ITG8_9ROSI|nr:hypothetical protein SLEP1_g17189 [Rubroshorea leprosula]
MQENNYQGKLHSDSNVNSVNGDNSSVNKQNREKEIASSLNPLPKPKATRTDNDWTELLGTPSQGRSSSRKQNNGVSTIHGLRKDGKRSDIALRAKLIGRPSDSEESSSSGWPSSVDMQNDGKNSEGLLLDQVLGTNFPAERKYEMDSENGTSNSEDLLLEGPSQSLNKNCSLETLVLLRKVAGASDRKMELVDAQDKRRSTIREKPKSNVAVTTATANDLKRSSSFTSDVSFASDFDSDSTSDSESECEEEERRRRREMLLAEKAVAKAVAAIKERENIVARLEGKKQSLEKILEE